MPCSGFLSAFARTTSNSLCAMAAAAADVCNKKKHRLLVVLNTSLGTGATSTGQWKACECRLSSTREPHCVIFSSSSTVRLSSMFFTSVFLHTSELRNTACEEFEMPHTHGNASCSQCQRRTWRSPMGSKDPAASLLTASPRCLAGASCSCKQGDEDVGWSLFSSCTQMDDVVELD